MKNRKWFFRPCHHYIMFFQREMDTFVNSFERNDHPCNFFRPRCHDYSMLPDHLLATTIWFQRYRKQSALSAMKRRAWISSNNQTPWKSSDNDHRTMILGGSDIEAADKKFLESGDNWIPHKRPGKSDFSQPSFDVEFPHETPKMSEFENHSNTRTEPNFLCRFAFLSDDREIACFPIRRDEWVVCGNGSRERCDWGLGWGITKDLLLEWIVKWSGQASGTIMLNLTDMPRSEDCAPQSKPSQ
jgi:hypothetical protein